MKCFAVMPSSAKVAALPLSHGDSGLDAVSSRVQIYRERYLRLPKSSLFPWSDPQSIEIKGVFPLISIRFGSGPIESQEHSGYKRIGEAKHPQMGQEMPLAHHIWSAAARSYQEVGSAGARTMAPPMLHPKPLPPLGLFPPFPRPHFTSSHPRCTSFPRAPPICHSFLSSPHHRSPLRQEGAERNERQADGEGLRGTEEQAAGGGASREGAERSGASGEDAKWSGWVGLGGRG